MSAKKTIDFYIRRAWLKIYIMYNQVVEKWGYSISMAYVLLNIDPKDGTPSTRIGPLIGLQKASLSRTLKSMESDGLIFRKTDPEDLRVRRVYLTDEGKHLRALSRDSVFKFQNEIEKNIDPKKLEIFHEVVEEITLIAERTKLVEEH